MWFDFDQCNQSTEILNLKKNLNAKIGILQASAWAYYNIPCFYMKGLTLNLTQHYQILKPCLLRFSLDFKFLCSEFGEKCDFNYQVFEILSQISRLFWSQGSRSRPKSKLLSLFTLDLSWLEIRQLSDLLATVHFQKSEV